MKTSEKKVYDFESTDHVKEASGFSLLEKNKLYEILINFGVPTVSTEDLKDDWELLRILLTKHSKGLEAEANVAPENIKLLEKFVS